MQSMIISGLLTIGFLLTQSQYLNANEKCTHPIPVCAWEKRIVGIKTPNMIASGLILDNGLIVTNRHVTEDHKSLRIKLASGLIVEAQPIPNDHAADLTLLEFVNPTEFPDIIRLHNGSEQELRVVAFDQGRNGSRIYPKGTFAIYPDWSRHPQARVHTDAFALPGNSGGAVITSEGDLVGILASGDGSINEVIPAGLMTPVISVSAEKHRTGYLERGAAIRKCADLLYESEKIPKSPPSTLVSNLKASCLKSRNKQLYDQAGQLFGKWWMFRLSKMFLKESIKMDPNSPNTLMSLAVAYHLNREYAEEKPILSRYLELNPSDPQALRLSVQVAGALQDRKLADRAISLMRLHNPNAVELAEEFLGNAFAN